MTNIQVLITKEQNVMNQQFRHRYELWTEGCKGSNVELQLKSMFFVYMKKPAEKDNRENQFSIVLTYILNRGKKNHQIPKQNCHSYIKYYDL